MTRTITATATIYSEGPTRTVKLTAEARPHLPGWVMISAQDEHQAAVDAIAEREGCIVLDYGWPNGYMGGRGRRATIQHAATRSRATVSIQID